MSAQNTQFFTIVARNYSAHAAVLGETLARWHGDAEFTVWVLDPGPVPSPIKNFHFRNVRECVRDDALYQQMWTQYDILELSTAVKPAAFRQHFNEGFERVIYLDPDIMLFRPLNEVMEALDKGACGVLIPHILTPLPRDNKLPSDIDIMRSGTFNLGFLALRPSEDSDAFLAWWWKWLQTHSSSDHSTGLFTDQKWINFVPAFWPSFYILRDTTYNVAYWNLHERALTKQEDQWLVNGRPLAFYHFSGFDWRTPTILSKHQTRFEVRKNSPLKNMLAQYVQRLQAYDVADVSGLPLPALTFDDGVAFDRVCQRCMQAAEEQGITFPSTLSTGKGSFRAWLSNVGVGKRFPNYIYGIFLLRPDVQQQMSNASLRSMATWMRQYGIAEMNLDRRLIEECLGYAYNPPKSVNYVGYLSSELGLGEGARSIIGAMRSVGIEISLIDISNHSSNRAKDTSVTKHASRGLTTAPINVYHFNADQLPNVVNTVGLPGTGQGYYNIGFWAWETLEFPDQWVDSFKLLNEVWVNSEFVAKSISKKSPVPVVVVPDVVEVPRIEADRSMFGLPTDEFIFLFTFDFHSILERKNPLAAIQAFKAAFAPSDPVRLVIKSMNGENYLEMYRQVRAAAEGMRVTFIDRSLSTDRRFQLMQVCDAYVSLHRAEGFGRGMAEAMAFGKPVIATGWSGNMEFMSAHNSLPVDFTLNPLVKAAGPYPAGTIWADASILDAADKLRRVWQDEALRAHIAERAPRDIAEGFSSPVVGKIIKERMSVISDRRRSSDIQTREPLRRLLAADVSSHPLHYVRYVPRTMRLLQTRGMDGVKEKIREHVRARKS
ncbi:MAG: glycosyltransferase [Ktedonobacterales bacterium]